MRNVQPEVLVAEALAAILADLQATLAALPRPAALIEAERRVIAARDARAEAWDTYRAMSRVLGSSLARNSWGDAKIHRAKAMVDAAEAEITLAQKALDRHRAAQGRTISAAIDRHRLAAAAAIAGAADILASAAAAAAKEHVKLVDVVEHTASLQGLIEASVRSQAAQRNRTGRDFAKAAAAISARALPLLPAAPPTKWTGKLETFFGGGIVDEGPRPIPGSSATVEKIPASAIEKLASAPPPGPLRLSATAVTATARGILPKR